MLRTGFVNSVIFQTEGGSSSFCYGERFKDIGLALKGSAQVRVTDGL